MWYSLLETTWGTFGYVAGLNGLIATFLPQARREAEPIIRARFPDAEFDGEALPGFRREVLNFFAGSRAKFRTPLDLSGLPEYRRAVLEACRQVPYGRTATYADLARAAGRPAAIRAAGSAMAGNPLPLVVPCHRIVRSDGTLGGFSCPQGVQLKIRLLRHEGASFVTSESIRPSAVRRRVG